MAVIWCNDHFVYSQFQSAEIMSDLSISLVFLYCLECFSVKFLFIIFKTQSLTFFVISLVIP